MPWYFYAFLSAILLSLSSLVEKKVLHRVHSTSFSASLAILNFIFSLPFIFIIDFSNINRLSLTIILVAAFLASFSFLFVAKALRKMEISTVSPILALNPGAAAIAAFIFLGERLSNTDVMGILLMVVGSYVLMIAANHGFKHHFKSFFQNKEMVLVFFSIIFYALASVLDRVLVTDLSIDPLAYLFFVHLFIAVIFMVLASIQGRGVKGIGDALKMNGAEITMISLFTIGYRYFQLLAFQAALVGLVSTIKRSSTFITTIIGGELFHEKHIFQKAVASVIIIGGCLLIVLK